MENNSMSFGKAIQTCFEKSFVFKGRAPRAECWWWTLFVFIMIIISNLLIQLQREVPDHMALSVLFEHLFLSVFLAYLIIATAAVTVRRLHDIGRSGWWYGGYMILWMIVEAAFIISGMDYNNIEKEVLEEAVMNEMLGTILVPFLLLIIYCIVLNVWCCQDSQPGTNKYGENPKGIVE